MKSLFAFRGNKINIKRLFFNIQFSQAIVLLALIPALHANGQVRDNYTAQESVDPVVMVMEHLLGPGATASNITFQGNPLARGTFNGTSNLGMEEGIILTSGRANYSIGPNNSSNKSYDANTAGDIALSQLCGAGTNDASVLEFDFIPLSETFKLRFVLGSEEYPEYVNQFNDVAGIFLSGPGITGSFPSPPEFPDGAVNIALVPGVNPPTYVSIDNINNGNSNNGPCINCQYYINNGYGYTPDINLYIQYDGFTTVFEAGAALIPGGTYHIKLAVADAGDDSYDTAILFESGSFTTGVDMFELPVARIFTTGTILRIITEQNGQTMYNISSVTGNIIRTGSFTGNDFSLSLQDYAPGIYIVRLVMNGRLTVAKIIR